jgi:hypothetical protein
MRSEKKGPALLSFAQRLPQLMMLQAQRTLTTLTLTLIWLITKANSSIMMLDRSLLSKTTYKVIMCELNCFMNTLSNMLL